MGPKRLKAKVKTPSTWRSSRRKPGLEDEIPEVYHEMLVEAATSATANGPAERAVKRRKLSVEPTNRSPEDELFGTEALSAATPLHVTRADELVQPLQQIAFNDFESSDGSDAEFEDVDLEAPVEENDEAEEARTEQRPLQLDLTRTNALTPRRSIQRRKPVTANERKLRLDAHKVHLLCLLGHLKVRNHWSQSEAIQPILKPLVSRKTLKLLHIDESEPQHQRSHAFNKGIEEICGIWRSAWTITAQGMRRAHWRDGVDAVKESEDAEDLIDFEDFLSASQTRRGSRDLGAQLFCALLRSLAVETRLVCSLQVLPFSAVAKGQTPEKPKSNYIHAPPQKFENESPSSPFTRTPPAKFMRKKIRDSAYPIFWVEVFSPASSTWIPLDSLVRNTINKPKIGFEPPASDPLNTMSYVIAFDDDGFAKDVTRRYAQYVNAKVRRTRVESTKDGENWWARVMELLEKPYQEPQDEIEDAALLQRAASEGMPKNVQDFKGHPVYVLERHLRLNEVIKPRNEVGKVSTGVSKTANLESVFRRKDVHVCRTADAWYRRGRDVREGETPLKRAVPKRLKDVRQDSPLEEDPTEAEGQALYAEYQTDVYEPPPVVDGQIPKNGFGNLDVYVPSMIPPGAIHVRHPLAAQAAKVLGIDFTAAVTGFEFKGRQGTAVVDGVVVSKDQRIAIVTVIIGLESDAKQEADAARSMAILNIWKRWLTALRVRERIHRDYGDREQQEEDELAAMAEAAASEDEDETYQDDEDVGGGFVPEALEEEDAKKQGNDPIFPTLRPLPLPSTEPVIHHEITVIESPHKLPEAPPEVVAAISDNDDDMFSDAGDEGGGFIPEDGNDAAKTVTSQHIKTGSNNHEADGPDGGGGFMPESEDEDQADIDISNGANGPNPGHVTETDMDIGGGGFMTEEDDNNANAPNEASSHVVAPLIPTAAAVQLADIGEGTESSTLNKDSSQQKSVAKATTPSSPTRTSVTGSAALDTADVSAAIGVASVNDIKDQVQISSLSSQDSMLSHDPDEDEDADPEWLDDALG